MGDALISIDSRSTYLLTQTDFELIDDVFVRVDSKYSSKDLVNPNTSY